MKKISPSVSVIVPVYNTEKYLKKCLDSLVRQTLKDIEIIVIDDGSPDQSGKIIDAYAKKYPQIRAIHKKNGGVGSAYNLGLKLAKGQYVGFIDSDDWVERDMFETLYKVAQKNHSDVVKSHSFLKYKNGKHQKKVVIPKVKCHQVIQNNLDLPEFILGHISHWAGIYKRSFLIQNHISFYDKDKTIASDVDFIFRVWLHAHSFYIIPKAFVYYRTDRLTSDRFSGAKMSFSLLHTHLLIRDYFKSQNVDKQHWKIKVLSEFYHLKFELQQRCLSRRSEFIKALSTLFWENISDGYVDYSSFPKRDLRLYYVIACLPFLYNLNDKLHFWIRCPGPNGLIIDWYFFGLVRYLTYGRLAQGKLDKSHLSFCGF